MGSKKVSFRLYLRVKYGANAIKAVINVLTVIIYICLMRTPRIYREIEENIFSGHIVDVETPFWFLLWKLYRVYLFKYVRKFVFDVINYHCLEIGVNISFLFGITVVLVDYASQTSWRNFSIGKRDFLFDFFHHFSFPTWIWSNSVINNAFGFVVFLPWT